MHHRGLDAVGPGAAIFSARGGERRARNLLGVEPERRPLWRIAADRQRARDGVGQKLIAEAGLIVEGRARARALGASRLDLRVGFLGVFNGWGHGGPPGGCVKRDPQIWSRM